MESNWAWIELWKIIFSVVSVELEIVLGPRWVMDAEHVTLNVRSVHV